MYGESRMRCTTDTRKMNKYQVEKNLLSQNIKL